MKKALFLFICIIIFNSLYSQDLVILNSGTKTECQITGIDTSKVYFITYLDGYQIKRSVDKKEVKGLLFNNKFEVIETEKKTSSDDSKKTSVVKYKAENLNNDVKLDKAVVNFYFGGGVVFSTYKGEAMYLPLVTDKKEIEFFPAAVEFGVQNQIKNGLSLQCGLAFLAKGIKFGSYETRSYISYSTCYIESPISIKIEPSAFRKSKEYSFFLKGGFAPAFQVSSVIKIKLVNELTNESEKQKESISVFRKEDLNYLLGFGMEKKEMFGFELSYEAGMFNIGPESTAIYNRSLSLNLYLLF